MTAKYKILLIIQCFLLISATSFAADLWPMTVGTCMEFHKQDSSTSPIEWTMLMKVAEEVTINSQTYFRVKTSNYDYPSSYGEFLIRCTEDTCYGASEGQEGIAWQTGDVGTTWSSPDTDDGSCDNAKIISIEPITIPYGTFAEAYVYEKTSNSPVPPYPPNPPHYEYIVPGIGYVKEVDHWIGNPLLTAPTISEFVRFIDDCEITGQLPVNIYKPWAFIEHLGYPGDSRHRLNVGVCISDPLGVPDNIESVIATGWLNSPWLWLSYSPNPMGGCQQYSGRFNFTYPDDLPGNPLQWGIEAISKTGERDWVYTHLLDKQLSIPLAANIQFSDRSTTPIITWDPVLFDHDQDSGTPDREVDFYRVYFAKDQTNNNIFQGTWITGNSFMVPSGIFEYGDHIILKLQAAFAEFNDCGGWTQESRSMTFQDFYPEQELAVDGTLLPGVGNRIQDDVYGNLAWVNVAYSGLSSFPTEPTDIRINVLDVPPTGLPGLQAPGTKIMHIDFEPEQSYPLPPMGLTVVIPLEDPLPLPGRNPSTCGYKWLELYRVDPDTGKLVPAQRWNFTRYKGIYYFNLSPSKGIPFDKNAEICPEDLQQQGCQFCSTSAIFSSVATFSKVVGVISESISVMIDIAPGSDTNPINVPKKSMVPVAILGSESLDVSDIDVATLSFGPNFVPPAHDLNDQSVYEDHLQDVNTDGYMDLVSHYSVPETGIVCEDTSAVLVGKTTGGENFQGFDSIKTVGCK